MTERNAYIWHGLGNWDDKLFTGTEIEYDNFRNAAHDFFDELYHEVNKHHFPNSIGPGNRGGKIHEGELSKFLNETFRFENDNGAIFMVHLKDGLRRKVYPIE